jgi:hypothetical protein
MCDSARTVNPLPPTPFGTPDLARDRHHQRSDFAVQHHISQKI